MAVDLNPNLLQNIISRRDSASEQISSGKRINSAGDDAAGLGITINISTAIQGEQVAISNAITGTSLLQASEAGLLQITESLQSLRQLTLQASSGILSSSDRSILQQQSDQLIATIQDTLGNTQINGRRLLTGEGSTSLQIGPNTGNQIDIPNFNVAAVLEQLGLNNFDLTDPSNTDANLDALDQSLAFVQSNASQLGAAQNRIDSSIDNLTQSNISNNQSRSLIEDADLARSITDLIKAQLEEQTVITLQAQANAQRGLVLKLLEQ